MFNFSLKSKIYSDLIKGTFFIIISVFNFLHLPSALLVSKNKEWLTLYISLSIMMMISGLIFFAGAIFLLIQYRKAVKSGMISSNTLLGNNEKYNANHTENNSLFDKTNIESWKEQGFSDQQILEKILSLSTAKNSGTIVLYKDFSDAIKEGWIFNEPFGKFGDQILYKFAIFSKNNKNETFEYDGLSQKNHKSKDDKWEYRYFGDIVYKKNLPQIT